jgi:hypothetical protein
MSNELIRPIAVSARAIEEASKAFSKAIEAAMQTGKYAGAVLGDLPHDLVGIIGDWVAHKRARRWAELSAETAKILRDRRIENREDVSPSVAIPLIAAAINEDRNVLKQLWAKLLASAMDPNRSNLVRPSLIELLKSMDPLDARVLRHMIEGVPMPPRAGRRAPESGAEPCERTALFRTGIVPLASFTVSSGRRLLQWAAVLLVPGIILGLHTLPPVAKAVASNL